MFEYSSDKLSAQQQKLMVNIAAQADKNNEQTVPEWDRSKAFKHYNRDGQHSLAQSQPWWQWQGVPALSMAFSVITITVMAFVMQQPTGFNQSAITALVNEQVTKQVNTQLKAQVDEQVEVQLARQLNIRLREFAAEQQVLLANYATDLSRTQQKSNLELASYILGASRQERKSDFSDFISYLDGQRQEEQLEQKIKFQQLEQAIGYQQMSYQPK